MSEDNRYTVIEGAEAAPEPIKHICQLLSTTIDVLQRVLPDGTEVIVGIRFRDAPESCLFAASEDDFQEFQKGLASAVADTHKDE